MEDDFFALSSMSSSTDDDTSTPDNNNNNNNNNRSEDRAKAAVAAKPAEAKPTRLIRDDFDPHAPTVSASTSTEDEKNGGNQNDGNGRGVYDRPLSSERGKSGGGLKGKSKQSKGKAGGYRSSSGRGKKKVALETNAVPPAQASKATPKAKAVLEVDDAKGKAKSGRRPRKPPVRTNDILVTLSSSSSTDSRSPSSTTSTTPSPSSTTTSLSPTSSPSPLPPVLVTERAKVWDGLEPASYSSTPPSLLSDERAYVKAVGGFHDEGDTKAAAGNDRVSRGAAARDDQPLIRADQIDEAVDFISSSFSTSNAALLKPPSAGVSASGRYSSSYRAPSSSSATSTRTKRKTPVKVLHSLAMFPILSTVVAAFAIFNALAFWLSAFGTGRGFASCHEPDAVTVCGWGDNNYGIARFIQGVLIVILGCVMLGFELDRNPKQLNVFRTYLRFYFYYTGRAVYFVFFGFMNMDSKGLPFVTGVVCYLAAVVFFIAAAIKTVNPLVRAGTTRLQLTQCRSHVRLASRGSSSA